MSNDRIESFAEFWPYYVGEHRDARCRALHYLGTTCVIALFVIAAVTGEARWLWAAPIVGYGPAWTGHFFIERNRPATFRYPLYSLAADFKMWWFAVTGRMAEEVRLVERTRGETRPASA